MKSSQTPPLEAIEAFKNRASGKAAFLTLGGTGPNACSQLQSLEWLGRDYVSGFAKVNIISGSAFGYFVWHAYYQGMLDVPTFLQFDKLGRKLHKSSLLKSVMHFARIGKPRAPLYSNALVKSTALLLFSERFANLPLSNFDKNVYIWAYCSASKKFVALTPSSHPEMKIWEVLSATSSVPLLHGEFTYGDSQFSDPIFSGRFKSLMRKLLQDKGPHLYLNYKKTYDSKNVSFVINQPTPFPTLRLLTDFLMFVCNIDNPTITKTHKQTLNTFRDSYKRLHSDTLATLQQAKAGSPYRNERESQVECSES